MLLLTNDKGWPIKASDGTVDREAEVREVTYTPLKVLSLILEISFL